MAIVFKKIAFFFCCLFGIFGDCFATHNRAGEITYSWISGTTYNITITTYTRISSPADRCYLTLYFGDGDSCTAYRSNGIPDPNGSCYSIGATQGQTIASDIRVNTYSCEHTYPGPGSYWIYMQDPNRNEAIDNIPNSVNIVFYIHSLLVINPFLGSGHVNSVVLLNPPIDNGCVEKCYYNNPEAYDVDGDSLAFKFVTCLGTDGAPIPLYTLPPSIASPISLNVYTGELTWCSPPYAPEIDPSTSPYPPGVVSEYNVAIWIEEWRQGYLVGGVERDMQINLYQCSDLPPVISPLQDTCVTAGQTISFPVTAFDAQNIYNINLSAGGGPLSPFVVQPAASFPTVQGGTTVTSLFSWQTDCGQIRKQPYTVTFRAVNSSPINPAPSNFSPLANYKSINLQVIAPAPTNLTATPSGSSIHLAWHDSACGGLALYEIYRLDSCYSWIPGYCETGVPPSSGYTLIGTTTNQNFIDDNNGAGLKRGSNYSYIVVAVYDDGSLSYASENVCAKLLNDIAIITNVDVMTTDMTKGAILVKWLNPVADSINFDTLKTPGPYEFKIMRSVGAVNNQFVQVADFSSNYFKSLVSFNDSTFIDTLLNTLSNQYSYRVDFFANNIFKGSSNIASSVFLSITAAAPGKTLLLSWNAQVPWINSRYVVYRYDTLSAQFVSIDTVASTFYSDSNLTNTKSYCYLIKSIGAYSDQSIVHPLLNRSQSQCGVAKDSQPPCPPALSVIPNCDAYTDFLQWTNPDHTGCCLDVGSAFRPNLPTYNVYYAAVESQPLKYLFSFYNASDTFKLYSLASIAGCFAVTAVDTFKNESAFSNRVCVDNCPVYRLPNVFTPNGDGENDYFVPFPYKFIKDIDLKIYDRWGLLVFETIDPNVKWDGKNQETKVQCSDGTYFYTCVVNEIHVEGIEAREIKGFVELISNNGDKETH